MGVTKLWAPTVAPVHKVFYSIALLADVYVLFPPRFRLCVGCYWLSWWCFSQHLSFVKLRLLDRATLRTVALLLGADSVVAF